MYKSYLIHTKTVPNPNPTIGSTFQCRRLSAYAGIIVVDCCLLSIHFYLCTRKCLKSIPDTNAHVRSAFININQKYVLFFSLSLTQRLLGFVCPCSNIINVFLFYPNDVFESKYINVYTLSHIQMCTNQNPVYFYLDFFIKM